jgi:hypothetical protein
LLLGTIHKFHEKNGRFFYPLSPLLDNFMFKPLCPGVIQSQNASLPSFLHNFDREFFLKGERGMVPHVQ